MTRGPRILLQMRENALTQRGGDTVVLERVHSGLNALGIQADIDLPGQKNLKDYDLVHLFNFCTPEIVEKLARKCVAANKPYLVTTMYEDWPGYFSQMLACTQGLFNYMASGQPRGAWPELERAARNVPPAPIQDNSWSARHAEALIASGRFEAETLKRDYPYVKAVEIYRCGSEILEQQDEGELFYKAFGLQNYILCVGRLETRKNQLMLLKALEDSDLPLVFITGGFSYQPQYEEACKLFRRRGPTHFLGRLESAVLASAFAGAAAHVLPSWCELPGIVSLEAARYGTRVVATKYGTLHDYLGDSAYYCEPDSAESICQTISRAISENKKPDLRTRAASFTWEANALNHVKIYEKILGSCSNAESSPYFASSPALRVTAAETKAKITVVATDIIDKDSLEAFRACLREQTVPADTFQTILVNNGQGNLLDEPIRSSLRSDGFTYLENPSALPFATVLAQAAGVSQSELVILLSGSTLPSPTFLEEHLKTHASAKESLAVFGPTSFGSPKSPIALAWNYLETSHSSETTRKQNGFDQVTTFNVSFPRRMLLAAELPVELTLESVWGQSLCLAYLLQQQGCSFRYNPSAVLDLRHKASFDMLVDWERSKARDMSKLVRLFPALAKSHPLLRQISPTQLSGYKEALQRDTISLQNATKQIRQIEPLNLNGADASELVRDLATVLSLVLEYTWQEELIRVGI